MRGPRLAFDHPDRWIECYEDLEEAFNLLVERSSQPLVDLWPIEQDLTEAAMAVGWAREEIVAVVTELAVSYRLRRAASANADQQIDDALTRKY
ncbi:MAG: hypothetical protein KL863_27755 [Rhizobium sp.]|nr:hypothetical protein [Rhizobium sp.]